VVYRKELNKRSPLRVFERSLHGGLGKGNIGVVTSRKGVGKTAFLTDIALDDLMRERPVLHVTLQHSVERVLSFYDEMFGELARSQRLEDEAETRLAVERHRHVLSYKGIKEFHLERLRESLGFLAQHAAFRPEALVLDGYPDFTAVTAAEIAALKQLAQDFALELWVTALHHREGQPQDERGVPLEVARFEAYLSVIVHLEPQGDHVMLRLVKDHENPDLAALHLELDPRTLLLRWS